MKVQHSIILCVILVFQCFVAQSQYPYFHHYNSENILPGNEIYCLLEDDKGYIWIGSDAGVFQFNGHYFRPFKTDRQNSLAVTGLVQGNDGTIYGYNFNGQLFAIKNGRIRIVPDWKHHINGLAVDSRNTLWITSDKGFYKRPASSGKIQPALPEKSYLADKIGVYTHSVKSHGRTVYFYNQSNLFGVTDGKVTHYPIPAKNPLQVHFTSFINGSPWILNQSGDEFFTSGKSGFRSTHIPSLQAVLRNRKITQIREIGSDEIWICTFSGIIQYRISSRKATLFWPEMAFSDCLRDRNGAYWFSTLNNGILYVAHLQQAVWNKSNFALLNEQLTHISGNADELIAGNSSGELCIYNFQQQQHRIEKLPFIGDIGMLYYDAADACFYLNQSAYLLRLQHGKCTVINRMFRPAKDMLHWRNRYFVATSQGTYCLTKLHEETITTPFHQAWSRALLKPSFADELWIATNNGLVILDNPEGSLQHPRELLRETQILALCESGNSVYALTFKGQLAKTGADHQIAEWITIDRNARFYKMVKYGAFLLLGSNNGIYMVHTRTSEIDHFGKEEGLVSNTIHDIRVYGDTVWLATNKGLQRILLPALTESKSNNRIYLNRVRINHQDVNPDQTLELHFDDHLEVFADGLCYRSLGNFFWEYRLNHGDWLSVSGRTKKLDFINLPAGNGILEVRLKDHHGKISTQAIVLRMHVQPPFYQQWWFRAIITVILLGTGFLLYKRRIRFLEKKQQKELQRIRLESDLRWSQQNALKAQMNPHFLFNVLNSIKGYIYENDKTNAIRYLSDFSSLVRDVLEHSSLPFISLKKELDFLRVYIDLESMLLDSAFTFTLEVAENLDPEGIEIPSMILQPYVENAFKHGLRHIQGAKRLHLKITPDETHQYILFTLEDNGIGIRKAMEINSQEQDKRPSFASGAIAQRIRLLNSEIPGSVTVSILDKQAEDTSNASGTIVQIRIRTTE